ncbi:uncharacterized protein LOC126738363 isoform X2 [Anthonomus grandis grandis]|uniref:uncharacterized protein LOC126738363 isoform X2 n=1 Tax=Anthonomus grandis grandis TaxID=2921223 RepID=UPI002165512E|nr:uncharacterized protein LOC126738363 isoform X2 [Anthonomus grandis grandis]
MLSMASGKNEDLSLQKDTIDANLATLEPIAINTVDQGSNSSDYVLQELQPISHYLSAENVNQDFLKIEASCSISNNKVSISLEIINIDDVIIEPFDNINSVQKDSSDIILATTESIRPTTPDAPLQMLGGDQASHKESVNSEDDTDEDDEIEELCLAQLAKKLKVSPQSQKDVDPEENMKKKEKSALT